MGGSQGVLDAVLSGQPKTVMSFAKALRPTPSEVSVASTVCSHPGQSMFEENIPPVPQVPSAFARRPVADDGTEQEPDQIGSDARRPQTPFRDGTERQKYFDTALAQLEGTHASSTASSECSQNSQEATRQETHEERQFQRWAKGSHERTKEIWRGSPEPQEVRAAKPHACYPFVADAVTLDTTSHKLKGLGRKVKDLILNFSKPTPFNRVAKQIEEASVTKAAWPCYASESEKTDTRKANRGAQAAAEQGPYATRPTRYVARPTTSERAPAKPQQTETRSAAKTVLPPGPRATGRHPPTMPLEDAQRKFLGHPELTPLFYAVTTAVRADMAMSQPVKPAQVVGSADRGTMLGDFIDPVNIFKASEDQETVFGNVIDTKDLADAAERPEATKTDESTMDEAHAYAAEYRHAIATPPISPADFSEIEHRVFPSNKRVLIDPKLSSHVDMPRFDEGYPDVVGVLGDDDLGNAVRESKLGDMRSKNSLRSSSAELVGNAAAVVERLGGGRKGGATGEWQEVMPAF